MQINQPVLSSTLYSTSVTTRDFQDQLPQAHTHTLRFPDPNGFTHLHQT